MRTHTLSTLALGAIALFASSTAAQGLTWNKDGPECGSGNIPRSCIVRGGDQQLDGRTRFPSFSDGSNCHTRTTVYSHPDKVAIPTQDGAGSCTITIKPNSSCKLNGKTGAQEVGLARSVVKRTPVGQKDVNGDVTFNEYCTIGAFVGSETRIL